MATNQKKKGSDAPASSKKLRNDRFNRDMTNLEQQYTNYKRESGDKTPIPDDYFSLFIEWALHIHEYFEEDLHSGQNLPGAILDNKTCWKAESRDHFFKSFFPEFLKGGWPIRFTRKFLKKLGDIKSPAIQEDILNAFTGFSSGNFKCSAVVPVQGLSYMMFFKYRVPNSNLSLVISVHIECYPEFDKSKKVKSFKYLHVARFLDILSENDKITAVNTCLAFLEDCKKDPARMERQPKVVPDNQIKRRNVDSETKYGYCFENVESVHGESIVASNIGVDHSKPIDIFLPNVFEINYLTPQEVEDLIFDKDLLRWVSKKEHTVFLKRQENALISKINAEVLQKFADFESSAKLVNLLEKMKNLKIKLTSEERRLIGQSGNVLAIGRSGTGKTTCCVLRLFSQEMLYKIRVAQAQVKHGVLRDARFTSDQLENLIGIHSVFVTASPVLTNEVQRYHQSLTRKIQEEIRKKEAKKEKEEKSEEKKEKEVITEITYDKANETDQQIVEEEKENEEAENAEDNDVFREEDYLLEDDEAEALAKFNKNYSLDNIEDKEFPLFLTLKRIVLMIDGTLQKPFFARKKDKSIIGSDTQAQWHNEIKGLMLISEKYRNNQDEGEEEDESDVPEALQSPEMQEKNGDTIQEEEEEDQEGNDLLEIDDSDIEAEYERYQAILKKKKEQLEEENEIRKKNKMNFEVDYEYFYNHFWQGYLARQEKTGPITPILVWSEMMSTIKGSAESHLHPGFCLSQNAYCSLVAEGSTLLSSGNRGTIYKLFLSYEEWKKKQGGYDFMDVVNHALNEIRLKGYTGVPIHFMMIDEVQDLSHATILLLMKITEQNIFFAGDTAQTIAKGVGVRFSDLSTLFNLTSEKELTWKKPTVHQLTVNFRSHSKILDIANSVVTLVETFFPKTIDKLKKEKSEVDGPKPILLEDVNIEVLFAVLFGTENFKSHRHSQNQGGMLEKPPIEFGCNQAIIVRDQESKKKLPPLLKHALCLTVYEAKGLEFDDVILYNFFSESPLSGREWALLGYLEIETKEVDKDTFDRYYFTYKEEELSDLRNEDKTLRNNDENEKNQDEMDFQAPNVFNMQLNSQNNKYEIKKVGLPKRLYSILDLESSNTLCNEFKQLYVALTRPRNRIIIYDDNVEKRERMERYWKDLSLVQIINKNILESKKADSSADKDLESFKSLLVSTSKSDWRKQGLKMFKNKYYEQAVKCFEKAEDEKLCHRALGYMIAEGASNKLTKLKSEQDAALREQTKTKVGDSKEKRMLSKQLKKEEKACYEEYEKAANIFFDLGLLKQASQCFFSAGNYQRAYEIYEELGLLREAGEACFVLKDYKRAADLFLRGNDIIRAIECYEVLKDYEKILDLMGSIKDLPPEQKRYYGKKYVPLALRRLTEEIQFKAPEDTGKNKEVVDEEASSSEEEEPELKKAPADMTEEIKESDLKNENTNSLNAKKEISNMSFDVIEKAQDKHESSYIEIKDEERKNLSDISFENVEDPVENFEHLSQYDLKDEFLKSESGSIIQSIISQRKDKSVMSSDFSAVEYNYLMNNQYHLVQTKADIFIQDSVMAKIIRYIEMFSDDFKENLQNLRSKDVLLTEAQKQNLDVQQMTHSLAEFDNISLEFIYFILDFLEQSGLFKLCIFVCNRYKLADKLGRYLVNMAFKYSNFPTEDIRGNFFKLFLPRNRQVQQEKAFVANTAVHNILEIIHPNYLKLKKKGEIIDDTNSLGDDCFSSLIALGFWKKCLFLMDYHNSLALASTFASFTNYKLIFLTGSAIQEIPKKQIQSLVEDTGFEFLLCETPTHPEEIKAAIIGLESVIWDLSEKLPMYLYTHYKSQAKNSTQIKVPNFPSYFKYNEALWTFIIDKDQHKLDESIKNVVENIEQILKGQGVSKPIAELRIFDAVSFLVQISLLYFSHTKFIDLINKMPIQQVVKLISAFKKIVQFISTPPNLNQYQETILRAIFSPLRVRLVEKSSVLSGIGFHNSIVHISSPIMTSILDAANTPPLIYDIEANFLLVPTDTCLKETRGRIARVIKDIVSFQARCNVPQSYEPKEDDIKKVLESRSFIIGMIHCYDYCSGNLGNNLQKKPEDKKNKKKPEKKEAPQVAYVDDNDDLQEEDEAYNDVDFISKQNRISIKGNKKNQAPQKEVLIHKNEEEKQKEKDDSLKSLQKTMLKSIKVLFSNYTSVILNLDYYSRAELLNYGLQKLNKYLQKRKLKNWIVHLFYAIDNHIILNETLRKHQQNPVSEKMQLYSDAIYYRKFFCSEQYVENIFQYISQTFNKLPVEDIISVLENLTPYLITVDNLGQEYKKVSLSSCLMSCMGIHKSRQAENILKANIVPLSDPESYPELFHWIGKVVDKMFKQGLSASMSLKVLRLIINIFANIYEIDDSSKKMLSEKIRLLMEAKPLVLYQDRGVKVKKSAEETKLEDQPLDNIIEYLNDFNVLDEKELDAVIIFYRTESFVTVSIDSNAKDAENNSAESEKAWLLDNWKTAKRISLQRKIKKLYFKKKGGKPKERVILNKLWTSCLLETINNASSANISLGDLQRFVFSTEFRIDIFEEVDRLLKYVMNYYGKSNFANPIDFHYINNLVKKMVNCELEYLDAFQENLKTKENKKKIDFQDLYKEKLLILEALVQEFEQWCVKKESHDKADDNFAKKKKLVRAKWEEETILMKMQQIAKKRKGIRKQAFQVRFKPENFFKKRHQVVKVKEIIKKARGFKALE